MEGKEALPLEEEPPNRPAPWSPLAQDDEVWAPPSGPVKPKPPVVTSYQPLPTHELAWEHFEKLIFCLAKEVEGSGQFHIYGKRGQAQHGIDFVGFFQDGRAPTVYQAKRQQEFSKKDLEDAVQKYAEGKRPFGANRLVVAVACEAADTTIVDVLSALKKSYPDLTIELWDREALSERVRTKEWIVDSFFGRAWTSVVGGVDIAVPSLVREGDDTNRSRGEAFTVLSSEEFHAKTPPPKQGGWISRATNRAIRWLHGVHRRFLEMDEPDATGEWEPERCTSVLRYVHDRDDGRCGLCGAKTKLKGAQVDRIVPKIFAMFNVDRGMAVSGSGFKSVLHKLDNLQAAHSYCYEHKGNSPNTGEWRHPDMPPLAVATTPTGSRLMAPALRGEGVLDDGFAPTERVLKRWAVRATFLLLVVLTAAWWSTPSGREVTSTLTDWITQGL